jgi:hypothetical protein
LSLCVTNQEVRHDDVWVSGCIDEHLLDLSTSWRWMVNFTPLPFYSRRKGLRHPLDRRLGGPQSGSRRYGGVTILDPTKTRNPTPRSSRLVPVALPTELSLLYFLFVVNIGNFFPFIWRSKRVLIDEKFGRTVREPVASYLWWYPCTIRYWLRNSTWFLNRESNIPHCLLNGPFSI